ncbi:MAG: hypothetical protein JKY65_30385, partial [Planctomycetes bacterium]|nr:hypothetical protein [Planctomycetota bacterium]
MSAWIPAGTRVASLALLLLAASAVDVGAQERKDAPAVDTLERIWVPERAFKRVLARHPGGVLLAEAELDKLIAKANAGDAARATDTLPPAETPRLATITQLKITGSVRGKTASLEARAEVAISGRGTVGLPLPLRSLGLVGVWVDQVPARVLVTDAGPVVLLPGSATPTTRIVTWSWSATVLSPANGSRGGGRLGMRLPAAASASLDLALPLAVEVLPATSGVTLWTRAEGGGSRIRGALGGQAGAARQFEIAWRPKVATVTATPYAVASDDTVFIFRRGVTSLSTRLELKVYRGPRQSFKLVLPSGFVVRELTSPTGGAPQYLQRGEQVELRWPTPRKGTLVVELEAERPSEPGEG